MNRALIVPAGGIGSRLGLGVPKLLVPVNGKPMIEHLLDLYAGCVESVALVVHPSALERTRELVGSASVPVELFVQETPTGMLDAILLARPAIVRWRPRRVWVTWCDQIAIHPLTIARLAAASDAADEPVLALPTCRSEHPYVHLVRNERGEIVDVLHRREGDVMPDVGEGDVGLFDLSLRAYLEWLPAYAAAPSIGATTGERNFVPFIAAAHGHGAVRTFPCVERIEAVGVNTPDDLARVEEYLRVRSAAARA
jgi:bifunctional UDP-N-acetylglucosamine pyrophosphorylase/glucosamine-1-phosphate N-acetyltransferase